MSNVLVALYVFGAIYLCLGMGCFVAFDRDEVLDLMLWPLILSKAIYRRIEEIWKE